MLKQLLKMGSNFLEGQVNNRFKTLANLLLTQCEIVKGNFRYDLLEIEFYYYNSNHPDTTTYKRITNAGRWFTHLSGVDIAFESDEQAYGGILIRSLRRNDGKVINGPLCCMVELFNDIDWETGDYVPLIRMTKESKAITYQSTTRFNINTGKYLASPYRYYNASDDIIWKPGYTAKPLQNA